MSIHFAMADTSCGIVRHSRANVLGVGVHAVNMAFAVRTIADAVAARSKGYVCATGIHGVMEAQRDPSLRKVFSRALLVVPDGMPTVWMGHLQGLPHMRRVFGPDLMLEVIGDPAMRSCSHFLYGGDFGVAQQLETSLRRRFPRVRIAGTYTPPFRPLNEAEVAGLTELVDRLRPDIMWVGLSTPKQERFMAEYSPRLNVTLMIGVGAAFDFHTGRLKDSPKWVKSFGLQWLHRLCQEPSRLWKRYLVNNPSFLAQAALQVTGVRRFELDADQSTNDDLRVSRNSPFRSH
jgi:N-acetylglucosaminyldiphosphoundecaprenol N-acetyl-beta-D-mannosaminyltransferase